MSEHEEPIGDDEPLEDHERDALRQDLVDVQVLKEVLGPKGIKGTVFYCPDCEEDHYLTWDLLAGNLQEILDAGESPIHEPAYEPDPQEYVSWDYARGFLDGYESFEKEELAEVTTRLIVELRERGWSVDEVKGMLSAARIDIPPIDPNAGRGRLG
ncbi:MAG: DUF5319 domain-containing protein [Actinomycetota bacterium]|nr:DUF5319 domain-containing protein [Actinomycetota bacterium]